MFANEAIPPHTTFDLAGTNASLAGRVDRESYRLASFVTSPSLTSLTNVCNVARHGYYFTGQGNNVRCFSCSAEVQISSPCEDSWLRRQHYRHCDFANGNATNNRPIQQSSPYDVCSNVDEFSDVTVPERPMSTTPSSSSSGHSGSAEVPMPTSSSSINVLSAHDPSVNIIDGSTNNINSSNQITPRSSAHNSQTINSAQLQSIFPCQHPANPHMSSVGSRIQSFLQNMSTWVSSSRLQASIKELAAAGLYYIAQMDRTKCWYCDGGLQNWKEGDEPWVEHAKWFPTCEYVLQHKGPDFVHKIVSRYPNLRRPILGQNNSNSFLQDMNNNRRSLSYGNTSAMETSSSHSSSGPVIVDPQTENRERNRKIEEALSHSEMVSEAKRMGFNQQVIKVAIKRQFELNDQNFESFEALLNALLALSDSELALNRALETSSENEANHQPMRNNDSEICKRCHTNEACMVFIPCGHKASCYNCKDGWEFCPVCQSFVREMIRSYTT